MKTKSNFAPEVMCVVAVRNGVLYTIGHGKKIRTYSGCTPTVKRNGYKTITGKNVSDQLMDHFLGSDDFVNTTVRGLQACFVLADDKFAAQPTRTFDEDFRLAAYIKRLRFSVCFNGDVPCLAID